MQKRTLSISAAALVMVLWAAAIFLAPATTSAPGLGTPGCAVTTGAPGCGGETPVASSQASASRLDDDQLKLGILNEVLASRNDNDPRLDRDLKILSPGARALLRARYAELAAEKRNERGTIVFLLGRHLESAQDFEFFQTVIAEQPCRSLKDCQSADAMDSNDHTGREMGIDVTLNYPQIVALKSLERLLGGPMEAGQKQRAIGLLRQSMASPVPVVAKMARELYDRYGGKS
jgi:hypothetical protein